MTFPGRRFFWGVIVVATILFGYYVYGAYVIFRYGGLSREFGWSAEIENGSWSVIEVDASGPVAGKLEVGDLVLSVDGDSRVQIFGPEYKLRVDPPEGEYTVRVSRGEEPLDLVLDMTVTRDPRHLVATLPVFAASLAFYAISIVVGLFRPSERMPQLMVEAGFACGAVLLLMCIGPSSGFLSGWERILFHVHRIIPPFHLLLGVRFFYWFTSPGATQAPRTGGSEGVGFGAAAADTAVTVGISAAVTSDRHSKSQEREISSGPSAPGRLWSVVYIGLWVWGVLLFVPGTLSKLVRLPDFPAAMDFVAAYYRFFGAFWSIQGVLGSSFGMAALVAMIGLLASNYGRIEQLDQRRRVKWVLYGTAAGVIPPSLVWLSSAVLNTTGYRSVTDTYGFGLLFSLTTAMPILVPLALGHAVAKHRVMGVDVVVRRGIQYLLARNVLRAILLLPIIGLVYTIVSNPDRTVAQLFVDRSSTFYLFLLVTGSVSLRYRRELGDWVDRKFFRDKYDQERILLELIENVKECDSLAAISELVCSDVVAALHPKTMYVFYRDPQRPDFALGHSSGGEGRSLRISERSDLLRFVEGQSRPFELGADRLAQGNGLAKSERAWLEELGVDLIVPMQGSVLPLAGLLLLGEKNSEEPYSDNNKKLLQSIADHVAVVCENLWLKHRVDRDSQMRSEVLAHLQKERVNLVKECPTCGTCFDRSENVCSRDQSELILTLPVERIIEDRYRLERVLGKGGMGAVYEATDRRLSRRVAVKIMKGHLFGQRGALRRFEREARACANLNHPNIIAVYDYGTIGTDGAFLVMELIQGVTLRAELRPNVNIDPNVAAEWFDQILDGLSAAHGSGIIHRDLKPENVMIQGKPPERRTDPVQDTDSSSGGSGPSIKILDFGLAKVKMMGVTDSQSLTVPGTVLGTCGYMSPEQLSGSEVDARSDLFSIGVMIAESLTGSHPFPGSTPAQTLYAILHSRVHLGGADDSVRTLEAVLQKSLAKNREERFSTAAEMRQTVIPVLQRCSSLLTPRDPADGGTIA